MGPIVATTRGSPSAGKQTAPTNNDSISCRPLLGAGDVDQGPNLQAPEETLAAAGRSDKGHLAPARDLGAESSFTGPIGELIMIRRRPARACHSSV